ncbi:MAG: hypothetical protein CM15mL5_0440 [uncultured marine virus]|nr:MAG: hypothetical protein CM15mL5_0440 [uncultured marine virus]
MKNLPITSTCVTFGVIIGTGWFLIPLAWSNPLLV